MAQYLSLVQLLKRGCRRIGLLMALVVGAALFAVGPCVAQPPKAKIAIAASLTGILEPFGQGCLNGALLAIEEANATPGEVPIEYEVFDYASDTNRAPEIARSVVASDALAVVGPPTTKLGLVVLPIFAEAGLASVGSTATGDSLVENAGFFRASFTTSDTGAAIANYLYHVLHVPRAIVLVSNRGFGPMVEAGFSRAAAGLGIATTSLSFDTVPEAEQAAQWAAAQPGAPAIVLAMISESVPVVRVLRRAGAQGPIFGTAHTIETFSEAFAAEPEEQRQPGYFSDGIYTATSVLFDSANAETLIFLARYRARYGEEPTFIEVHGYEAARVAIAAVRAALADGHAADLKQQRAAVIASLQGLDGPASAVPGLSGPLWFTPERNRLQQLRIGRFYANRLESAPVQLVPAPHPDRAEIASGAVVNIGNSRYARLQQVVYTGIYLNEISRIDIPDSTFTADFYLWMRYSPSALGSALAGAVDPFRIVFPDLISGAFEPEKVAEQGELADGTRYRLWHIRGDFRKRFHMHDYPVDRHTLSIRFFHATADSGRLVYILDERGRSADVRPGADPPAAPVPLIATAHAAVPQPLGETHDPRDIAAPEAFSDLSQWKPVVVGERRDILVTHSALGDPRLVGVERQRELSGFMAFVDVQRRIAAALMKTLLPLALMTLILFASLFFSARFASEKITVSITAALSGAVLLSEINGRLGQIGYTVGIEYVFYVYFLLCLLSILVAETSDRLRLGERTTVAVAVERSAQVLFLAGILAAAGAAWLAIARS